MKKNEMVISLALLAVFLAAVIAAGFAVAQFGLSRINQALDSLDPQTGIVLGVSAIVALLCSALIGRAIGSAKQREIDSHVYSERAAIYQALTESLGVLVSEGSNGGRNGTGDLFAVEKALFLRGSVAVNNEYRALLRLLSDPGADAKILRAKSQDSSSRCAGTAASLPTRWKARIGRIWCGFRRAKLLLTKRRLSAAAFPRCSRGASDPPPLASRMTPITQISCLIPTADRHAFDAAGDPVFSGAGLPGEGIDNCR